MRRGSLPKMINPVDIELGTLMNKGAKKMKIYKMFQMEAKP